MANTTYNIRIDKDIRDEADALFKSMGLTLSSAINLFLTQSVVQGRLPLNDVVASPAYINMMRRDAAEVDHALAAGKAQVFDTPEDLFKGWEHGDV